jgi:diguanylate cyclase (GGDEF)-like protein
VPGQSLTDPQRLLAIASTGLVDGPPSARMERIPRLVSRLLQVPVALASFVEPDRQFIVAATGFDVEPFATDRQAPLSHCFCRDVVLSGEPLRVPDSREPPWLEGNRAVDELGIIAYLGVPLADPGGQLLGSLCAIDSQPRDWTAADEAALCDLAELVTDELRRRAVTGENEVLAQQLREQTCRDSLTGMHNRRFWDEHAPRELARCLREGRAITAVCIDLDGFKALNDERGHAAGDDILVALGARWRPLVRAPDVLVRWGGDEFVLLLDTDVIGATAIAYRLVDSTRDLINAAIGVAAWDRRESVGRLLERADQALLIAKRSRS